MALDGTNGKEIWRFEDNDPEGAFSIYVPLIDQKQCYLVSFQEYMYGLSKETGKLLWRYKFKGKGYPKLRFQTKTHVAYTTHEETAQLIFIDKQTGREAARYDLPSEINRLGLRHITDVVADNNLLFAILEDGRFYALANMGN